MKIADFWHRARMMIVRNEDYKRWREKIRIILIFPLLNEAEWKEKFQVPDGLVLLISMMMMRIMVTIMVMKMTTTKNIHIPWHFSKIILILSTVRVMPAIFFFVYSCMYIKRPDIRSCMKMHEKVAMRSFTASKSIKSFVQSNKQSYLTI